MTIHIENSPGATELVAAHGSIIFTDRKPIDFDISEEVIDSGKPQRNEASNLGNYKKADGWMRIIFGRNFFLFLNA